MDVSVFCDNCGKKFAAKYKLLDHIKNAQDDTAYPCDDCKKTLDVHIEQQHVKKLVQFKGSFVQWENNEDNSSKVPKLVDLFSCEKCEYESERKSKLNRHIKLVHEKVRVDKPVKCDVCDYTSPYPSNVKKHMKTVVNNGLFTQQITHILRHIQSQYP